MTVSPNSLPALPAKESRILKIDFAGKQCMMFGEHKHRGKNVCEENARYAAIRVSQNTVLNVP